MPDRPEITAPPAAGRRPRRRRGRPEAHRLRARFAAHLRRSGLLPPDAPVLVALSGGVDSVVLLHLLRFGDEPRRLVAAHLDHAMRPGSAADAAWVAGLCRAWGIPLVCGSADPPPRTEAAARDLRYAFLERQAAQAGAALIATAHHLDDQAETVLFRAARGAGLRGLAGILPRRGAIVRPLLPFTRAEILDYARAAGLRWREDPSNAAHVYARNRLRAEVLPPLERAVPGAVHALARLAARARAAERGWDAVLDTLLEGVLLTADPGAPQVARDRLLAYPSEVQGRILRHLLRRHGFAPGWAGTTAAVEFIRSGVSGTGVTLEGGVRLEREFDRILVRLLLSAGTPADRAARLEGLEAGEVEAVVGGCSRRVRWGAAPPAAADAADRLLEVFDASAIRFPLELRGWRSGDRIRLPGGTKKLKKLFAERRVGRSGRSCVPILVEAGGRILWVVGFARAPAVRPVPGRPALYVTVTDVGR
jgi:tRNA(Ile)-lysidine synthase